MICLHDLDGKYLYVSTAWTAMLGFTPDEFAGASPYELIHSQDHERVRDEAHARLLRGETGIVVE